MDVTILFVIIGHSTLLPLSSLLIATCNRINRVRIFLSLLLHAYDIGEWLGILFLLLLCKKTFQVQLIGMIWPSIWIWPRNWISIMFFDWMDLGLYLPLIAPTILMGA